ncbi:hypothetical protein [Nocardia goodfellowii]|uniref:Uncharacterized protein n=1 Tax=Nocardia goodfellowii TaxID=882446 RepID=A0ABS4QLZ2_9NOCA|nr:hypothetical protein [Nocardia goodfellowii]MBP2192568.1 hypothetical protein [Nocardia goodfellowii]
MIAEVRAGGEKVPYPIGLRELAVLRSEMFDRAFGESGVAGAGFIT